MFFVTLLTSHGQFFPSSYTTSKLLCGILSKNNETLGLKIFKFKNYLFSPKSFYNKNQGLRDPIAVSFTNVLQEAFTLVDPEIVKKD